VAEPGPGPAVLASGPGPELARSVGWMLALIGFVVGARTIADNSFLTHLATGQLIAEGGRVPTVDPYSLVARGEPWTVQSWLVSVLYAWLDANLGGWAIRLVNGGLGLGITLGLWRLVAPARQLVVRTGLVSLAVLTGTYLWPPRPLLFGLAALVLTLQVVQGLRPAWWLVPVFWFWVNCHGSFVLGLVLIGSVAAGAAIDRRQPLPRPELRLAALAVVGCLAGAVNPLGWRLLWFPVHLMGRGEALDRVAEWRAPTFRSVPEQLFASLLVLVVVAAARGGRWRALVPALAFFASGLLAVRNLGVASLVVVTMVAPSLAGLVGRLDGAVRSRLSRVVGAAAGAGLAAAVALVVLGAPVDLAGYPRDQVDWLEARSLVASDGVVLAQRETVGNYLTLRYGPEARVFMDDRFDFHPPDVIADHNALVMGGDMAGVLDRRRVDVVLWATGSPLERWLARDPAWDVVQRDHDWFIACRRTSAVYSRCVS
jgi:hypothetical protein